MIQITIGVLLGSAIAGARIVGDNSDRSDYLDTYKHAKILQQNFENSGAGPYLFSFTTSDGTHRNEEGTLITTASGKTSLVVKGSYKYVGTDGNTYFTKYTADENGFHPEGEHIKVSPFSTKQQPQRASEEEQQVIEPQNLVALVADKPQVDLNKQVNSVRPLPQDVPELQPQAFSDSDDEPEEQPVQFVLPNLVRMEEVPIAKQEVQGLIYANTINSITDGIDVRNQDDHEASLNEQND